LSSEQIRDNTDYIIVAEMRLLHLIYNNPKLIYTADSGIDKELLIHKLPKDVYEAIAQLHHENIPITASSLLQRANEINFEVEASLIDRIVSLDNDGTKYQDVVSTLKAARIKENLKAQAQVFLKELSKKNGTIDQTAIGKVLSDSTKIMNGDSSEYLKSIQDWGTEYKKVLEDRQLGKRYTFGNKQLDKEVFKGAYPGAITILSGSSGSGKSTYTLNLVNALINMNQPCIYVTLEMSSEDTYDRLMAMRTEIPISEFYKTGMDLAPILKKVEQQRKELEDNENFYVIDNPKLDLIKLEQLIREYKQRTGNDYVLVFIDLLTQVKDFMSGQNAGSSVPVQMEIAVNDLNALAKSENCHIFGVVQFNRNADSSEITSLEDIDKLRGGFNDIKNAAALGERARLVLSVFRPKFYADRYLGDLEETDLLDDIMEISVLKNSSGKIGTRMDYMFNGPIFKVYDIEKDD